MLDIVRIRENKEEVIKSLGKKGVKSCVIDNLLKLDESRRANIVKVEELKAKKNEALKQVPILKKQGKDVEALFSQMKEESELIKSLDEELNTLNQQILDMLLSIPNMPHESVPVGKDDTDNVEIRKYLEPKKFSFEAKAHWDIGEALDILDFKAAANATGARFVYYKGLGARLERALINFMLDTHTGDGFTEVFPPYMVHRKSMVGTGQLPKFEEDAFKIFGTEYFLIPTAEVPVTNMLRETILNGSKLPINYTAYSACFRAEAGSAGRDTRGLIRQHQFNKVELVKFVRPETSYEELEKLTAQAEKILKLLKLPYRVVCLSTGDMSFTSAKTYDIEVYMPSYQRYVEISSCSNFEDYQARRAGIKFKDGANAKARFLHTLNGSGLAVGRTVAAILENYQNKDGSVAVPEVLRSYMRTDIIN
ncbi:MAG: serine--tRNA ligase [Eubacteriales bacterium]